MTKAPSPVSPAKFQKLEFKDTTTSHKSDYSTTKITPIWTPSDREPKPMYYKPISPRLTPTGRYSQQSNDRRSLPPSDTEGYYDQIPRPKFEPIDKHTPTPIFTKVDTETSRSSVKQKQMLFKPKPVAAKPVPQPHQQQAPQQFKQQPPSAQPTRYYTSVTGPPQHIKTPQGIATETSNLMQMRETTETCNRVVNMAQTKRVIQLDENRNRNIRLPTPTKFIPAGEWRESDYESELESTEIRPLWTPNPMDSEQRPQYRRVSAPRQTRAASVPKSYGSYDRILTPMEFDNRPIQMPNKIVVEPRQQQQPAAKPAGGSSLYQKTQTLDRYSSRKTTTNSSQSGGPRNKIARDDIDLRPSSPPEYGFMPASSQVVSNVQRQMQDMNSTFKSKASQFLKDTIVDGGKKSEQASRPFYQKGSFEASPENDGQGPQAYRDETRCSEYGEYILVLLVCFSQTFPHDFLCHQQLFVV